MANVNILNRVRSLEAYFQAGLQEATGLRKQLEGFSSSAAPSGGLKPEEIVKLKARSEKRRLRK